MEDWPCEKQDVHLFNEEFGTEKTTMNGDFREFYNEVLNVRAPYC